MTSRVLLLLLVLGGATWALYPTYQWYILLPESERALISLSQEEFAQASDETKQRVLELHDLRKRTLSLGLDLQGGVYVVLAPDEADLRESLMSRYSNDEDAVDAAFEREKSAAVEQVAEVLRNRLDQFGVAEPSIRTTYDASVIIEMPGLTDPQMIRQSLAQVGKLEFRLVDETSFQALMAQYPEAFNAEGLVADVNQLPEGFTLPEGSEFVPYYVNDSYGVPQLRGWYILLKQVLMDGDALQTARADVDNFGQNIVSFTLTAEGTDIFGEITRNNLNRRLAISLDGRVKSAPVIQGEIIGQGQISGSFSQKEALYLESVLRAGAFPVKIEILQEQVIGPTLGKTSI